MVLDPQESPGEIKSREVDWLGSYSWTTLCFSRDTAVVSLASAVPHLKSCSKLLKQQ